MRRSSATLVIILLTISGLPMVQAQAPPVEVLSDGSGDVDFTVGGTDQTDPGLYGYLDLEAAVIQEDEEGFTFTLTMETLDGPVAGQGSMAPVYSLYFTHSDTEFQVQFFSTCFFACPEPQYFAQLLMRPVGNEDWTNLANSRSQGPPTVDGSSLVWWLPRDLLADQQGAAPFPGRELTDLWAYSKARTNDFDIPDFQGGSAAEFPAEASDRMPDTGVSSQTVPITFGLTQSGDIVLTSDEPFRASNGEATTFLYTVNATNRGAEERLVQVRAAGLPSRWTVDFPIPTAVIGPGEHISVPVLLSTPFAHQHGGAESFVVEVFDPQSPSQVGRVELGIRYLEIPQPAGHHDTVFFHSAPWEADNPFEEVFLTAFAAGAGQVWMNAEETDDLDSGDPVTAQSGFFSFGTDAATSRFYWVIPLSPALRLGLDGDLDGLGDIAFEVSTPVLLPGATVTAELALIGEEDRPGRNDQNGQAYNFPYGFREVMPLASMSWEPVDIDSGSDHLFETQFPLLPDADFIRYDPAQNLALSIVLDAGRPDVSFSAQDTPSLEPGGRMSLPLFEYQDPVDEAFAIPSGPLLTLDGPPSRLANAGDIMLFDVTILDQGNAAGDYELEITGQSTHWAALLSSKRIKLDGDSVQAKVAIEVPATAETGDRADLFLQAVHAQDPTRRGLVRMVVDVDESRDHEDDSAEALQLMGPTEDAPAIAVLPVVVLLGAIALARRRP